MSGNDTNQEEGKGDSSCLPSDAFRHFSVREQQLLQYNEELEKEKNKALEKAHEAMRDVENLDFKNYQPSFLKNENLQPLIRAAQEGNVNITDTHIGPKEEEGNILLPTQAVQDPLPPSVADLQPRIATRTKVAHPVASANEVETLQNTIRFQKARIIVLQEELDKSIKQLTLRDGDNAQLRQDNKTLTEENKKLMRSLQVAEGHNEKLKKNIGLLEQRIKEFEKDITDARKENDTLSLQVRKQEQDINSKQGRVNRLIEDAERYRSTVKELKSKDQDQLKTDRKEQDRLLAENRKLERQRNELVGAFKKQMKLIDILKKQRTHLEAARVLSFTEDEFIRILDLGDKLGTA